MKMKEFKSIASFYKKDYTVPPLIISKIENRGLSGHKTR